MIQTILIAIFKFISRFVNIGKRTDADAGNGWFGNVLDAAKNTATSFYTENENGIWLNYVNHNSQMEKDDVIDPHITCFPTSISMALRTLNQPIYGGKNNPKIANERFDNLIIEDTAKNNMTYRIKLAAVTGEKWIETSKEFTWVRGLYSFWVWYINNNVLGCLGDFKARHAEMTVEEIKHYLRTEKKPVVVGIRIPLRSGGFGGHVIVIRGFDENGFYVNDPYGNKYEHYRNHAQGENLLYPFDAFKQKSNCILITHK
jgi:hypothetical protein